MTFGLTVCAASFLAPVVRWALACVDGTWASAHPDPGRWYAALALLLALAYAVGLGPLSNALIRHQRLRQLRQPPACGACLTRHRDQGVTGALILVAFAILLVPVLVFLHANIDAGHWSRDVGSIAIRWLCCGLASSILITVALSRPLDQAATATSRRALLCLKAASLWDQLGDRGKAIVILESAHAELQRVVGRYDPYQSWVVAPALARALCDAGRGEESSALHASFSGRRGTCSNLFGNESNVWDGCKDLLLANLAVAARVSDAEVLALLDAVENAAQKIKPANYIPLGWRATGGNVGEVNRPAHSEWDDFLDRMAQEGPDATHWRAFRATTLARATRHVGMLSSAQLRKTSASAGVATAGDVQQQRDNLLSTYFSHPAWEFEGTMSTVDAAEW
jgi:hypothetical protein